MDSGLAAITPEMTLKLSPLIGSTPAMYLRIQAVYDLNREKNSRSFFFEYKV